MEFKFLNIEIVKFIHADFLEEFGGSPGIRDAGLLSSAIAQPESGIGDEYFHKDIFEMAAAYVYHIIKNQPFVDGNKRAGWAAGKYFLELNGYRFDASPDEFHSEEIVYKVAEGSVSKMEIAEFLRKYSHPEAE